QLLERADISLAQEIAGLLPAEDVARRHAPGRTVERAIAGEEVQEKTGMHQLPLLALAQGKDAAKKLLGLAAIEEMRLVGRALIGVAGRNRDADFQFLRQIEEGRDIFRRMAVEDRRVDIDGESLGLGLLDRRDGDVENAAERHRLVVVVLQSVQMHGKE